MSVMNLVDEFRDCGELSNNIKLLHYGSLLMTTMDRYDMSLGEILNGINEAARQQIGEHNLGRAVL